MPVLGIDVSHYQGNVDWHRVASSQFRFAYMKASDGPHFEDPMFQRNWAGACEAGLLHGAYHFGHPGSDPEAQAAHFASIVGTPAFCELPPVLDLETMDGLPASAVIDWTIAFVRKAESLFGRPLMLYTGGLWRRSLGNPQVNELSGRMLWTARYSFTEPIVPKTFQRWDFWQFTEGKNGEVMQVPGVQGRCDCNRFRGDEAELIALTNIAIAPAPPPPPVADLEWPKQCFVWPHQPVLRSQHIRTWQARMKERGYAIDVDGAYGAESKTACIALQRDAGLTPDGIVGRDTWTATFDTSIE